MPFVVVNTTVRPLTGQELLPFDDHVVAVDRIELDRKLPAVEAHHGVAEHRRLHLVDALDPPPRGIDEHRVVGEVLGERTPACAAVVDDLARLDVALDRGFDLVAGEGHWRTSLKVCGTGVGRAGGQTMIRKRRLMQTRIPGGTVDSRG